MLAVKNVQCIQSNDFRSRQKRQTTKTTRNQLLGPILHKCLWSKMFNASLQILFVDGIIVFHLCNRTQCPEKESKCEMDGSLSIAVLSIELGMTVMPFLFPFR